MPQIRRLSESALRHLPELAFKILSHNTSRSVGCFAADLISTLLQSISVLGLIYLITEYDAVSARINELTELIHVSDALMLFALWSSVCMVLVFAGLCGYWSRRTAVAIARDHEEEVIRSLLFRFDEAVRAGRDIDITALGDFLARGPHYLGRLALEIHLTFVQVFTAGMALFCMAYLSWHVTLLVILFMCVSAPVFVFINRQATDSSKQMARYAKSHATKKKELVAELRAGTPPALVSAVSPGVDHKFLDSYELRLAVTFRNLLYTRVMGAMVFFAAIIPLLYLTQRGNASLAEAGIYFVLLVYFFNGLQGPYRLVTRYYTFYPYLGPILGKEPFIN